MSYYHRYLDFNSHTGNSDDNLGSSSDFSISDLFFQWLTFLVLYNNFIPISVIISMEIVRFQLSSYISFDIDMTGDNKNSTCRTSSVIEDLGRVSYIFTDKTGTLTKNQMVLKKLFIKNDACSINSYEMSNPLQVSYARIYVDTNHTPLRILPYFCDANVCCTLWCFILNLLC